MSLYLSNISIYLDLVYLAWAMRFFFLSIRYAIDDAIGADRLHFTMQPIIGSEVEKAQNYKSSLLFHFDGHPKRTETKSMQTHQTKMKQSKKEDSIKLTSYAREGKCPI